MFGSPCTWGRISLSISQRCHSSETPLSSSNTSGVTRAPTSQSAATAAVFRHCTARSKGHLSLGQPLTSAPAFTKACIRVRTVSSETLLFIATRLTAVCACISSSPPESSEKMPSSSLLSPSIPSHSHTRPQTQVILRQPSLRCVGTPHPGHSCAWRAFSERSRSLQVTPLCHEDTLQRKQNCSPQQGVRCRGKRCSQASWRANRRSRSSIQLAWPLGPSTLFMLLGGAPPLRCPQENSSRIVCRNFSAGTSARKKASHAIQSRSRASVPSMPKGFPALAWPSMPGLR
mmetsp:Transcript_42703/g.99594  ORF Transcript_42703/g.99594 Transcript_42703/m.99594 type:complete len:288 (-) Transcript_42703:1234-2097(-)